MWMDKQYYCYFYRISDVHHKLVKHVCKDKLYAPRKVLAINVEISKTASVYVYGHIQTQILY